jgi:dienelactone hydrolase
MFEEIACYSTPWKTLGNPIDIYYPNLIYPDPRFLPPEHRLAFPIAVLLPGFGVSRGYYSHYARQVAGYGFVVIVPDGITAIRSRAELFTKIAQVPIDLARMAIDLPHRQGSWTHLLDLHKLVLLGHSHGGTIGLDALRGALDVPLLVGDYSIPSVLIAAVFFGTFLWKDNTNLPIDRSPIPIALISGSLDSLIAPHETQETYKQIQNSPKAYIMVKGANHYGITNRNNPPGSPMEPSKPTIEQAVAIETIARWSALFVRAYALDDQMARQMYHQAINTDANVEVLTDSAVVSTPKTEEF